MSNETVVSFLQDELLDLVVEGDSLDKWHQTIEEMGLDGQKQVVTNDKSPIPYLHMTPAMVATFETLCPREVELAEYSAAPIPLKALEHIKLAKQEGHFDRIVIRYDDKSPDPVAIGIKDSYTFWRSWGPLPDGIKEGYSCDTNEYNRIKESNPGLEMKPYRQARDRYLIARWGAEDKPLEELAQMAKARYIRNESADLNKSIKEFQNRLSVLEEDATKKFEC